MGKFIEEENIINNYIGNYIKTTNDFSKYIEGSPTFVIYYSQDVEASTQDIGLGGVMEIIGSESPIKFNRIESFPIYNVEEFTPDNIVDDEIFLDTELESSATILGDMLQPLPNDYLIIPVINKKYLFKITNVEQSNINERVFYKVRFKLSNDNKNILEERQVNKRYNIIYENIGKDKKSIIIESDFILLKKIKNLYSKISNDYIDYFYNKTYNTFLFQNEIYDNNLIRFISKNNFFIKNKTFLKNILIEELVKSEIYDTKIYNHTIFNIIDTRDKEKLIDFYYVPSKISNIDSVFNLYKNIYNIKQSIYTTQKTNYNLFDEKFIENIKNNILYENNSNNTFFLLNIIIQYINYQYKDIQSLLTDIEKINITNNIINYLLIPCILFILKKQESILQDRVSSNKFEKYIVNDINNNIN